MTESNKKSIPGYTGQRSPALTLTCVLTFTWSGLTLLGSLMVYALYDQLPSIMQQGNLPEQEAAVLQMINSSSKLFFLFVSLLNALSFTGAMLMWKLRKVGFHFYTIAQLLILAVPFLMVEGYSISLPNAIITIVFIAAYAVNLPQMR